MNGYGVGLRVPHHRHLLATSPSEWGVDFFEVISEDFFDSRDAAILQHIATHCPIALHGVELNIGGTDPLDLIYLAKLNRLINQVHPIAVSDHLCWTGVAGISTHELLALPYSPSTLAHVIDRVDAVQNILGQQIMLENPSSYIEWRDSTMPEWEFINHLVTRTDCGVLLDVNNVYVSAINSNFDPALYVKNIPVISIGYIHIAGHAVTPAGWLLDTHDQSVSAAVWELYRNLEGNVPTLLEWDANIPSWPVLIAEVMKARKIRE